MNELNLNYKFSVAPMMGVTTSSARYMYRLISKEAVLFTEMIASQALHRGDFKKMLRKETIESPVVLQVGGSDINLLSCLLYTSPSPRDLSTSRMPSSA